MTGSQLRLPAAAHFAEWRVSNQRCSTLIRANQSGWLSPLLPRLPLSTPNPRHSNHPHTEKNHSGGFRYLCASRRFVGVRSASIVDEGEVLRHTALRLSVLDSESEPRPTPYESVAVPERVRRLRKFRERSIADEESASIATHSLDHTTLAVTGPRYSRRGRQVSSVFARSVSRTAEQQHSNTGDHNRS